MATEIIKELTTIKIPLRSPANIAIMGQKG